MPPIYEDDEPVGRTRLCVDITPEEQKRMQELIPWGTQSAMVRTLVMGMLAMIEEYGEVAIALLLTGKISTFDVIRSLEAKTERSKHGTSRPEAKRE